MRGVLLREGVGLLRCQRRGSAADLAPDRDDGARRLEDDPLNRGVTTDHEAIVP